MLEGDQVHCGQPAALNTRQMLMAVKSALITPGKLLVCVLACVLVRVCIHVNTLCVVNVGILNVCSSVFVMRLQDTVFPLFSPCLESPLSAHPAGSVSPPLAVTSTARQKSDLYLCPEFSGMESFGPKRPLGCCPVCYFVIVVMHTPSGKQNHGKALRKIVFTRKRWGHSDDISDKKAPIQQSCNLVKIKKHCCISECKSTLPLWFIIPQ